ncbi:MAG: hypothetical protein JSW08_02815 [archaeon]|nr:MAG: hypothetical protein JSW08_02815 [archaeon]
MGKNSKPRVEKLDVKKLKKVLEQSQEEEKPEQPEDTEFSAKEIVEKPKPLEEVISTDQPKQEEEEPKTWEDAVKKESEKESKYGLKSAPSYEMGGREETEETRTQGYKDTMEIDLVGQPERVFHEDPNLMHRKVQFVTDDQLTRSLGDEKVKHYEMERDRDDLKKDLKGKGKKQREPYKTSGYH